jgi:hypothetical protein
MQIWSKLFYFSDEICKEVKIHFRMNPADNVYFGAWNSVLLLYHVKHLLFAEFPGIFLLLKGSCIRTEFAIEDALIGGLNVKVPVEKSFAAKFLFADVIGKCTEQSQFACS